MNRLEYHFDCLDGRCLFVCEFDELTLSYDLESTIEEIPARSGELSREDLEKFDKLINAARIESWEKEYKNDFLAIEDGIRWKVKYHKDNKEYVSCGQETYEPYGYEEFINALKLCVDKADYFKAAL